MTDQTDSAAVSWISTRSKPRAAVVNEPPTVVAPGGAGHRKLGFRRLAGLRLARDTDAHTVVVCRGRGFSRIDGARLLCDRRDQARLRVQYGGRACLCCELGRCDLLCSHRPPAITSPARPCRATSMEDVLLCRSYRRRLGGTDNCSGSDGRYGDERGFPYLLDQAGVTLRCSRVSNGRAAWTGRRHERTRGRGRRHHWRYPFSGGRARVWKGLEQLSNELVRVIVQPGPMPLR